MGWNLKPANVDLTLSILEKISFYYKSFISIKIIFWPLAYNKSKTLNDFSCKDPISVALLHPKFWFSGIPSKGLAWHFLPQVQQK